MATPGRATPADAVAPSRAPGRRQGIPDATVARLPIYLRALHALNDSGVATISSDALADASGVNSAKVRKDLSHLGSYGTRGVGYDVEYLVYQISRELGLTQHWRVAIVGIGNLGHALANYGGFASRGFEVVALVDADKANVGEDVNGTPVTHIDQLPRLVAELRVNIGVIATPAKAAQEVCDRLVEAGVTSILNFAPTVLSVPADVQLRKVDLSTELQILAFHEQRKALAADREARGDARSSAAALEALDALGDEARSLGSQRAEAGHVTADAATPLPQAVST
ncbi:MAG: redox-sensing transcriptional repressor [Frankiaceae bacterium]|nr:redox-sensing transcriptional repressor [Frankiaceae bacterium]